MKLADYLKHHSTTQTAFAAAVGVTIGRISQLLNGERPSLDLATRIHQATEGAVTFADWMDLSPTPPAPAAAAPSPEAA
jgi:3,4-dihydroxy 2-butanone 4-phosphate synthase / GTP cyclohydrolase II